MGEVRAKKELYEAETELMNYILKSDDDKLQFLWAKYQIAFGRVLTEILEMVKELGSKS